MKQQHTLMKIDPAFGTGKPWPSHAHQWRDYHGGMAWIFNPWTEHRRHPADVGSDPFGLLIVPPEEPVYADCCHMAENKAELLAEEIECLHMSLDDACVPRTDESGAVFSVWGRVMRFKYGSPGDDNGMQLPTPGKDLPNAEVTSRPPSGD